MERRLSGGFDKEFLWREVGVCGEKNLLPKMYYIVSKSIRLISSLNNENCSGDRSSNVWRSSARVSVFGFNNLFI
jgi:hypothetical protein